MNENILKNQKKAYSQSFNKYGSTPDGIYWNNTETQYLRFERILNNIMPFLNCNSIHDVGSGICDLHKYLLLQNIQHEYSGTEIVQEMIDYSLSQFPEIKLYNRDLLTVSSDESYDFLVLSGTMNLLNNQDPNEWKEYCFNLIRKMYDMTRKAISFNCLTSYNTFSDPSFFILIRKKFLSFALKIFQGS
jgi:hypothetical protein